MCFLRSSRAMVPVSIPSISITPSTLANLNSAEMRDDFPAPVRPTTPTCDQFIITFFIFKKS